MWPYSIPGRRVNLSVFVYIIYAFGLQSLVSVSSVLLYNDLIRDLLSLTQGDLLSCVEVGVFSY